MSPLARPLAELVSDLEPWLVDLRRELHRWPEEGWMEFRTASRVAAELETLGYRLRLGAEAVSDRHRLGLPAPERIEAAWQEAKAAEVPARFLAPMRGGLTGVVADFDTGRPGPTVGFRFDMDALPICEADDTGHRPAREGWRSENTGSMHACGHDGHVSIGLGLARIVAELAPQLRGRVRLIFQPAEEGGRGALSMVEAGACTGVDDLICIHVGLGVPGGTVVAGSVRFLATTRLAATFRGRAAHAGLQPEEGRSAIVAAAQAVLGLHSLPQHAGGVTRVNVGIVQGGVAANIVAPTATLEFETRSDHSTVNDYLEERAREVVMGAAAMHGCSVDIRVTGRCAAEDSHLDLAQLVGQVARQIPGVQDVVLTHPFGASEDATYLMAAVHRQGGRATYIVLGTELAAGHHNERFDFDEGVLGLGVRLLGGLVLTRLSATAPSGERGPQDP